MQGTTIDLRHSGKTGGHGGNVQALSAPNGFPLRVSDVKPSSTHDLTAAHEHVLGALYDAASRGLPTPADGGYDGTGIDVHTPSKQPPGAQVLNADNRTYNALPRGYAALANVESPCSQGGGAPCNASPSARKFGNIIQTALALPHSEHSPA